MGGRGTVLANTNCILAFLDRDDRHHAAVVQIVQTETILIPATVLPEVDYLTTKYLGESKMKVRLIKTSNLNINY